MVMDPVIDCSPRYVRRDDDRRYTDAEKVEAEPEVVLHLVVGRNRAPRRLAVEETAVLVVRDDQKRPGPDLPVAPQRVVDPAQELVAQRDAVRRVLAVDPPEVARLEEAVSRERPVAHVVEELAEGVETVAESVPELEVRGGLGDIAGVDRPRNAGVRERIEDAPVAVEPDAVVDEPVGLGGVSEEPVRPRLTRHGREPPRTHSELAGECRQHRDLFGGMAAHDVARQARILVAVDELPCVVPREATHVDRVMTERRIVAGELADDVGEAVAWVCRHVSICGPEMDVAARALRIGQVLDVVGRLVDRSEATVVEVSEHVVERPILEHDHDNVLDRWDAGHGHNS